MAFFARTSSPRHKSRDNGTPDILTASDIAAWSYCPESWRLSRLQGHRPGNPEQIAAGHRRHAHWHGVFTLTRVLIWLGLLCLLAGLMLLMHGGGP